MPGLNRSLLDRYAADLNHRIESTNTHITETRFPRKYVLGASTAPDWPDHLAMIPARRADVTATECAGVFVVITESKDSTYRKRAFYASKEGAFNAAKRAHARGLETEILIAALDYKGWVHD